MMTATMATKPSPRPTQTRTPFVGREQELRFLEERLLAAERGQGGLVLLHGEPGAGKTRLLLEASSRARKAGWLVLTGRAYDTEGMPPYLPFVEALREYFRSRRDDDGAEILSYHRRMLTLLLPELGSDGDVAGPPLAGDPARYELFESISEVLLHIAARSECRGLLLSLDDLHWADSSCLSLLRHLSSRLESTRILIAGSYRTGEVDTSHAFFGLLAELTRERLAERLALMSLSVEETRELVISLGVEAASPVAIEGIHRQTQGNPFYIEEVVRHLNAEGVDLRTETLALTTWGLPQGVREVIGRRLLSLPEEARRLLESGAVLGDGFQFEIAALMSGPDEETLMAALDVAIGTGMLKEVGEVCHFAHPLIQRTVYDSLSGARRRALHLRAAQTIEAAYAGHTEPVLSALAVNYRLAGSRAKPEKAVDFSVLAGAAAAKVLAYEEACANWQAALEIMDHFQFEAGRRAELLARLADLMQVMGFDRYADSAQHFRRAIELYDEAGAEHAAASVRARLGLLLGAGSPVNDNSAALKYLREAEQLLVDSPPSEAQLWLYSGLGLISVWQINPGEGLLASNKAMELAGSLERDDRWSTNAVMCGYHMHAFGRLAEGFHLMALAWERADETNQTYPAYVAASWTGNRYADLLDPRSASLWFEKEVSQKRQDEAPSRRRFLWSALAGAKAMSGEMALAKQILAEQRAPADAELSAWLGDWDQAAALWTKARLTAAGAQNQAGEARAGLGLANLARLRGDLGGAEALLNEALAISQAGPHRIIEMKARSQLAVQLCLQGRLDEAEQQLAACRAILTRDEDWRGILGRIALAEALLGAALKHHKDAEGHFMRAVALFRQMCLPWDEAEAYELRARLGARLYRGTNRWTFVSDNLAAARAIYERIEAGSAWLDRLHKQQRSLLYRGDDDRRTYPDGLTAREVEVLRLLGGGESNREIANRLVISLRTVERHISNIYAKIGARGKADAVAYALRNSLT